jgi:hypothetical protein
MQLCQYTCAALKRKTLESIQNPSSIVILTLRCFSRPSEIVVDLK